MNSEIKEIVSTLDLQPHPEGGFYKETYRSFGSIPKRVLGDNFTGERKYCTAIYFLLTSDNFSAFHRIKQDEIWHFYKGSALYVHVINPKGIYTKYAVGTHFEKGEQPQLMVPAGCWFASSVKDDSDYSLVGCTVSPGFDFNDFELAERKDLIEQYPLFEKVITQYTRM